MTDKYDEFKEWFMELENIPSKVDLTDTPFSVPLPAVYGKLKVNKEKVFELFEKEQAEKQKEKQIKKAIKEVFNTIPLNEIPKEYHRECCTVLVPIDIIDGIYQKLKQQDLIK